FFIYTKYFILSKEEIVIINYKWILCPICGNKTRLRIRVDTILKNFPLYCPKCKNETLINVQKMNIITIKEPDAKTQSR
ncbi:hypothetical protein HMPREF1379_00343, partial [Enterococcus faecium R497]